MPSAASPLDNKHLHKAVEALLTHVERTQSAGKAQLLDENVPINVIIGTKVIPDTKGRTKPYMITLKHALYDPEDTQTCLFVKDPQREYKDKLQKMGITSINRVIGVSKLRSKFKQYEAQRQLCSGYDLFFADDRVLPLLPHLIGKVFFEKKKQPLPVNMTRASLGEQFTRMLTSTPFYLSEGLCSTVKAGHTGMTAKQIAENIAIAVEKVATVVPKEWAGIQAIHIKTGDSIALPIYHSVQSLPGEPAEEGATRPAEAGKKRKAGAVSAGEAAGDRGAKTAKKGKAAVVEEKKAVATPKKEVGNGVTPKKIVPKAATPNQETKAAPTPKKEATKAAPTPKKEATKAAPTPKKVETKAAPTPKKAAPTPRKEEAKAAPTPRKEEKKAAPTPKKTAPTPAKEEAVEVPKSVTKTAPTPKKVAKAEPTPKKEAGKTPREEVAATPKPAAKVAATPKSAKAATPAVKGGVAKSVAKSASKAGAGMKMSPGAKKSPSPAKMITRKKAAASAHK